MSEKPEKQRKRRYNSPLHTKQKYMSARLSEDLSERFGKRSAQLRTGDKVKVMRGDNKGTEGSVNEIDLDSEKVYVEDATLEKTDGSEIPRPVHPSNLMITELDTSDKKRVESLER